MNQITNPTNSQTRHYEIHISGQLDESWSEWLEGMEVKSLANKETVLIGIINDQAALMGILNKLNRLNLALLSIKEIRRK